MRHPALIMFSLGITVSSWAAAATVEPVQSPVSVSRGQGYMEVTASTKANVGDQVMAGAGGHARIVYPDGCAVDVYPGAVVTVPAKCYEPMRAGLVVEPPPRRFPWVPVLLGAAVIGVGVCAVACDDDDNGRGGRSP